jgi:hypothetical protein
MQPPFDNPAIATTCVHQDMVSAYAFREEALKGNNWGAMDVVRALIRKSGGGIERKAAPLSEINRCIVKKKLQARVLPLDEQVPDRGNRSSIVPVSQLSQGRVSPRPSDLPPIMVCPSTRIAESHDPPLDGGLRGADVCQVECAS